MKGNRLWKWCLLAGLIGVSLLLIYPPGERLKPGIDLAGGTSLIYEIDMTGLEGAERSNLSQRVMAILKARVDPNQQFNLVWRPIGNNRLEIQMPRPPAQARERREEYEKTRDKIREKNITRQELEQALVLSGEQRTAALEKLSHGVDGRAERLKAAAEAWDAYIAVKGKGDIAAEVDKQQAYEAALEAVEGTTLPIGRVTDVLALPHADRTHELEQLKKQYPAYTGAIDEVVVAYDKWASKRGTLEDAADLKRLLRGAGVLEFRILAQRDPANPTMLKDDNDAAYNEPAEKYIEQLGRRGPRAKADDRYEWFEIEDLPKFMSAANLEAAKKRIPGAPVIVAPYAGRYYVLAYVDDGTSRYALTHGPKSKKWALKRAMPSRDFGTNRPCVDFQLDPRGGIQFAEMTKLNINRQMAIFLDNIATSHATIISQISERGQITGNFTQERVLEIVRKLEAGSLPARLKETPLQEKFTGPTLGEINRKMGLRAATYAGLAVIAFMLIYYFRLGLMADIAVTINILVVLALMAAMEATFTLPGIAGLALTVGMAVDANVLINERIREELGRGLMLKKAVKVGYEKAFATILDSHSTTLISSIILGYVGSEEVKGFAMTLGFGVAISLFTALFVTRLILDELIDRDIIKRLPMLHLIRGAHVDWIGKRRLFYTLSGVATIGGLLFFVYAAVANKEALFDIELLGGSSVQVDIAEGQDMSRDQVIAALGGKAAGPEAGGLTAAGWLRKAADELDKAKVEAVADAAGEYRVAAEGLDPAEIKDMLLTSFEQSLAANGFTAEGKVARFRTKAAVVPDPSPENSSRTKEVPVDQAKFEGGLKRAATYVREAATRIATARVQTVSETAAEMFGAAHSYEIVTVEPNKEIVRAAVLRAFGDKLKVDRRINFDLVSDPQRAPDGLFPIKEEANFLGEVIGGDYPIDIRSVQSGNTNVSFKGGVAFVFDHLDPPQTITNLERRFREMRLQPQFEHTEARETKIIGLQEGPKAAGNLPTYTKIAVLVVDESIVYSDNTALWEDKLARPELAQATEALAAEKSLSKVVQFAPQLAKGTQQQAIVSLVLAIIAIVIYVWFRFSDMQFGLAAIIALLHDVAFTMGLVALADYFGWGEYKVDLSMIAAFLTIVGFSINDTIVIFDRIRETRGKMKGVNAAIINQSINATLSRTILTSGTALLSMVIMFIFGGPGVRGFCFAMIGGIVTGTYSSVAIAAPLVLNKRLLHTIVYVLCSITAIVVIYGVAPTRGLFIALSMLIVAICALLIAMERRAVPSTPLGMQVAPTN